MSQDHNTIYSIVERLRILEEGLDKNQRSVNQLSATFKPKTVAVLTAKTDPKNPLAGKLVGDSVENNEDPLEEAVANEDVLDKVKASFADYLKTIADEIKQDTDLKDKKHEDSDLKSKDTRDRDLVAKESTGPVNETSAVKVITNECGMFEVHGNEQHGFEIRHSNRRLPTRFKNLNEAELALEMFNNRRHKNNDSQDYIDEA